VIESVEDEDEDSTMEEDNDDIAATYIQTFDSLPKDVQCSVAQAVTPKQGRNQYFSTVTGQSFALTPSYRSLQ